MTTKILIGLAELQSLISSKPEIEIELLDKAVPQLAGLIARKVEERAGKVSDVVKRAVDQQLGDISRTYSTINSATRTIIQNLLKEELDKFGRSIARQTIDEHLRPELRTLFDQMKKDLSRAIEDREAVSKCIIDAYARLAAEREALALMRGMGTK